jgi:acetyl-CoA carboxylase biotin carboxyl carrier protein
MERFSDEDLKWLLELLAQEGLLEIEVASGEAEVCVRATSACPAAGAPAVVAASALVPSAPVAAMEPTNSERLLSPMAGIFYRASGPEVPHYAEPGDEVHVGDTIGLIEAMKLYNEVTAHVHGRIVRFLADNEQHVDADQPLVLIECFSPWPDASPNA